VQQRDAPCDGGSDWTLSYLKPCCSICSYIVVLRTREIGIRMALGAKKREVLMLMLRESTRPVAAGLLKGAALAVGAKRQDARRPYAVIRSAHPGNGGPLA
jgi:hypothetical protein